MTEHAWQEQVEAAILRQDAAALRALYAEAQQMFGEAAGQRWAQALSAFDALAVTG